MIRVILSAVCVSLLFSSCLKKPSCDYDSCAFTAPANEIQAVQDYLTNNSITATQHCSGVFYEIKNPGTGASPGFCSYITFEYIGRLTNGSIFDQSNAPVTFNLNGLVPGWINIMPLIKTGGRVMLYIPPSLGYGSQDNGTIPGNSILIFEVDLLGVQ